MQWFEKGNEEKQKAHTTNSSLIRERLWQENHPSFDSLQGNWSLWEKAKFSLDRKSKLNNKKEDVDVRNYFKDQLRIPENIMEDYQRGKGIKGGMNMGV